MADSLVKQKKNAGVELLRIFAMLLIIAHHYSVHGGFEFSSVSSNSIFIDIIALGGKIGVNLFVLITGYYSSKIEFSFKRFFKLILQVEFYSVLMSVISLVFGAQELSKKFLLKMMFPFFFGGGYWFICIYLLLYLCIPFINKALIHTNKRELGLIIWALVFLWTLMPYTVGKIYSFNDYGYSSFGQFILIYLVGAYLKKYSFFLYKRRAVSIILCSFICMVFVAFCAVKSFVTEGIIGILIDSFSSRNAIAIFPMIISVLLFIVFQESKIKSNSFLLIVSSATFGVYLIHDSPMFSSFMWEKLLHTKDYALSKMLPLHAVCCVAIIFAIGTVFDIIRIRLFENIIMNMKIINCLCEKMNGYVNKTD